MTRIFLIGDSQINGEIRNLLSSQAEIYSELNNEVELIIESSNYPLDTKLANIKFIDERSSSSVPVLTSSLCINVSEQCSFSKQPERLVGIGMYPTFSQAKLLEIAPSKITDKKILGNAEKTLESLNLKHTTVPDCVGLVFPRILAMIINEAAQIYSEKIASREDIDTAMKLGTNYPFGPLKWADRIGIDLIYNILTSLQNHSGEDRYSPHLLLKEMLDLNRLGIKTKKGFYDY